jgi:hypothetical protein
VLVCSKQNPKNASTFKMRRCMAAKKEPTAELTAEKKNAQRSAFINRSAIAWLRLHRPDVLEACKREADKKWERKGRSNFVLPTELENLK